MRKCSIKNCTRKYRQAGYCWRHYCQMYRCGKILERTIYDKNEYRCLGETTEVVLYNKQCEEIGVSLVDTEDVELLQPYKWGISGSGYTITRNRKRIIHMHRLLNKTPHGYDTDHINGNRLDNRKCNLRTATRSQNLYNKKGIRGVSFRSDRNKWRARIFVEGKELFLGHFDTKDEALRTRLIAEQEYFGEFSPNISGSRPGE